jgi:phosphoenolpyruvate carboxykinase (ATP)
LSSALERTHPSHVEEVPGASAKWNLTRGVLYEEAIRRGEGLMAVEGPLVCRTGEHTGRSPQDKFFVREPGSEQEIAWGSVNRAMSPDHFDRLHHDLLASLGHADVYVQEHYAGADPKYRMPVRVITEYAWHSLFARSMLIVDPSDHSATRKPRFTIIDSPSFKTDPSRHGSRTAVVIAIHFAKRLVLIAGTSYAGEIKKAVFTVLNGLLPLEGVLPMHCSANIGQSGDTALFFGLSGTGKTTLSSDSDRRLIGDDEHGWSDHGIFNFEGGCYAKTIRLSAEAEPQIYATTRRFGTVLENVALDLDTRALDLNDDRLTENTRAAYPISFIDNAEPSGLGGHPQNVIMLTADSFGVLPPISRLTADGAIYHFLSGYTARVAGTEKGVTEPTATFSTCFGAPFLPLAPQRYSKMLGERIAKHHARVWLVNTGWTGGGYGVGHRMKIAYTREMIRAALSGVLDTVAYERDERFNLDVPTSCPNVPTGILNPRGTWSNPAAYDEQAAKVARLFADNFKAFEAGVTPEVRAAGPRA